VAGIPDIETNIALVLNWYYLKSLPIRYWYKIGMTSSLSTRWVRLVWPRLPTRKAMGWAWYRLTSNQSRQFFCTRSITNLYTRVRASPPVHSMWLHTVKFIAKKSKCAGLVQEISFFAPNLCSFQWLVNGTTQLWTSKKECNKLNLTAPQYFWLVDHNGWSRWFAICSPHKYAVPVTVLLAGLPK
jgi:hypothetical protein